MSSLFKKALVAGALSANLLFGAAYNIDISHSSIEFSLSHMTVSKVSGNFAEFSGVVEIDPKAKNLTKLEGEIKIESINTKNKDRDAHLLADEYFNAGKFPNGVLKATKISKDKKGIKVEADLMLKGITKKVVLTGALQGPVQNPMNKKETWGLQLDGKINRKDFNIGKDTSGVTMGEEISISIGLELHAK